MSDTAMAPLDTHVTQLFEQATSAIMANKLEGVNPAVLKETILHHFRLNPDHADCTPESIVKCMVTASRMNLSLAAREIHFVPYGKELTPSPDYKGLLKLGYQSGLIASLAVSEVCEGDAFRVVIGDGECFVHEPNFEKRGKPYLYYVFARMKDGTTTHERMTLEEIDRLATNTPAWRNHRPQMSKKTVVHRFFRQRPHLLDEAVNDVLGGVDAVEYGGTVIDATFASSSTSPAPRNAGALVDAPPAAADRYAQPAPATTKKVDSAPAVDAKRDAIAWAASDAAEERVKNADVCGEFRFAWRAAVALAEHNRTAAELLLTNMSACFKAGEHHRTQLDVVRGKSFGGAYRTARKVDGYDYTDLAAWVAAVTLATVGEVIDTEAAPEAVRAAADLVVDVDDDAALDAAREVAA